MTEKEQHRLLLKFLNTKTYTINRQNYVLHLSRDTGFLGMAAIEDYDGSLEIVDVSELRYENFEEMIDLIIEKYEEESHITV